MRNDQKSARHRDAVFDQRHSEIGQVRAPPGVTNVITAEGPAPGAKTPTTRDDDISASTQSQRRTAESARKNAGDQTRSAVRAGVFGSLSIDQFKQSQQGEDDQRRQWSRNASLFPPSAANPDGAPTDRGRSRQ